MSCVHPTTPKLGAAAGGRVAGNQHEQVLLAAPSPRGNKDSISRLAVFQRRDTPGSAEGFAGGGTGLGSACAPSLIARRVWSTASCRQVQGTGCDLRLQASRGRGRVMVRRGGRCKEGGKSRENFLYESLASAKQERCLFNRVCSQPCGRRALKNSCLRRAREGQKAPISVAQERQILDVPTLIPGPCAAAPKTGGAA